MKRLHFPLFAAAVAAVIWTTAVWAASPPKLVVAIVVDQFRYDYLTRFRSDYNSGITRLLAKGAVFTDASYIHAATVTAVGHSTFLTGATPSVSGIVGNNWYDRALGRTVENTSDPDARGVGVRPIPGAPGSSPRQLLVSTVGDELKLRFPGSHVVGVSIKDRGAIMPAGHMADGAYWFDDEGKHWVTSTYYRDRLPQWVTELNAQVEKRDFTGEWYPLGAAAGSAKAYCTLKPAPALPDLRRCGSIEASPIGNELIEEFTEKELAADNLGGHDSTDILTVSFSSNDYVGHLVGPDAPEVRDISIRTDRLLGKLMDYVDSRVGAGNVLYVLTADHGVAPVPEVSQKLKMPGGRLVSSAPTDKATAALSARFGDGQWFVSGSEYIQYLNLDLISKLHLNRVDVERVAADAMQTAPHIARVYTRSELQSGSVTGDPIGRAFTVSFFAQRSGDLFVLPEPYWLGGSSGTTHGTPYWYDAHVPLIFMGPGIKPGVYRDHVAINDVAPTLSGILGVETPSGSSGKLLVEILDDSPALPAAHAATGRR